jgi:AraC family transcriptional regulator, regulatory protein of adaptative response / methylated-DNA-[protein]-cysteine methyltransferase
MNATLPSISVARRAVEKRDSSFDGRFVYAVSSTRIYCRPSCASRRPTRSRVEFYASPADAERAGFRACKRCRPATSDATRIDRAVAGAAEFISAHATEPITLSSLALRVGVSPFHLQRAFKRAMGVTPREFRDSQRRRILAGRLRSGDTVSRATYEAGYGSSSRVYEKAGRRMGMSPSALRKGGEGERMQFSIVASPLGRLLVAYTERGVCSVAMGDDDARLERQLRAEFPRAIISAAGSTLHAWISAIVKSLEGNEPTGSAAVPLDARGTAFQTRVWKELQRIPRGTTLSYSQVANRIGQPKAARAVARACATNPLAIVVPCHRVIREDGALGGYRWGLERKERLLRAEGATTEPR